MSADAEALLRAAEALWTDPSGSSAGWWSRGAAVLLRQALEQRLHVLVSQHGVDPERASFTACLLVLPAVVGERRAAGVAATWSQLSAATHVNGYALPPTQGELETWASVVRTLLART